jgi:thiamine transport system substrate-binding protein
MVKFARFALAVVLAVAALPAAAEEVPILRVYTYDSFAAEWGPGPAIKAGFEKTCTCVVEFVATDSSIGALRRVQLEGAETEADIVLGLDTAVAGEARATGLFEPHGLDLAGLALPTAWTDPEFVPFDYGYFAFVYDKDLLLNPPASFEDLIALPDDVKIVIEDPRSDTPGLGLVLWIKALYGDRAAEIWTGLKPHILTVARGWSEAYALFLNGEADLVLSYTTSPAYHAVADNDVSFAAADFGSHYAQIEVAGIVKSSQKQQLARDFLAYLVSPETQAVIPTTNWMYPVTDIGDALPAAFNDLIVPDTVLLEDEAEVTANKNAWIEEALGALQ